MPASETSSVTSLPVHRETGPAGVTAGECGNTAVTDAADVLVHPSGSAIFKVKLPLLVSVYVAVVAPVIAVPELYH